MLIIQDNFIINLSQVKYFYINKSNKSINFNYNKNNELSLDFDDELKTKEAFNKILEYYKNNKNICYVDNSR